MVFKIKWKSGGETAERYSSESIAKDILKRPQFMGKGTVVKTKLGEPGRTSPFKSFKYGDKEVKEYPKGKKLFWTKRKTTGGIVYTKHINK